MTGGGPRYDERAKPDPADLLLDPRKERIEQVIANRTRNLTVVLDRLEDTFNMAAVLRTCEGMGLQDIHIVKNPEVPFQPNGSVTQGCDKWLDLHRYESFAECRAALHADGFRILVSAISPGAQSLFDLRFDGKVALVFGNERFGVTADVLEQADGTFWIPMHGFSQSLNISAAASATVTRAVSWRMEHLGAHGDLSEPERNALRDRFSQLSVKQRGKLYGTRR